MEELPPIPTPFHQRWREFRIQVLPIIVFLITLVTIVYLWRNYVHPSEVVGQVQTNSVAVITINQGSVADVIVNPFETVAKGQPICRIDIGNTAVMEAALAATAADLKVMQARINLDKFRNQDSLVRMRLDLLTEQVAQSLAEIRLKNAEAELKRATVLYDQKLITEGMPLNQGIGVDASRFEFGLDVARRDRDILQAEVTSRSNVVVELQKEIKQMAGSQMVQTGPSDPAIEEAIRTKQEEVRLLNQPVVLKAPIDGVVTVINKHAGEKVVRGDAIVTISSAKPSYIVGYIRQPVGQLPRTNDTVTVSTRAHRRQSGKAVVLKVGAQLELINPLLISPDASRQEMGLPFLVSVPEKMRLIPGEFVDLKLEYAKK